ncbi:hypothetical protein CAPTEDRAFT_189471 [Capitella teleta]|uniref:RIIa domain-containing protein n=1 Tax=Capitella teleta TaxID=283909 RepID=R7V0G6_CAPTE|nr:hypothetical protein CAPTEDRAFT_189471 [Capitella teleta]|eukprot:ELU12328.1 hypothetical protein CAPTEDRAFT_189471 [Capitella teleta]
MWYLVMSNADYLKSSLCSLLVDAVVEVCVRTPRDPIEFIALFLKSKSLPSSPPPAPPPLPLLSSTPNVLCCEANLSARETHDSIRSDVSESRDIPQVHQDFYQEFDDFFDDDDLG